MSWTANDKKYSNKNSKNRIQINLETITKVQVYSLIADVQQLKEKLTARAGNIKENSQKKNTLASNNLISNLALLPTRNSIPSSE